MKSLILIAAVAVLSAATFGGFAGKDPRPPTFAQENFRQPMRVMVIGAHPDDADFQCGATAIKLARAGARVVFVSMCNGNKGHATMASKDLAARRYLETQAAAKHYGIEKYIVGDTPDCEIEPTLELRAKITRLIREFAPHCVITHRPCDYHADHRAVATSVLDAIYMLGVPLYCPETPVPEMLPFVLYTGDRFTLPRPCRVDMVVSCDDVIDQLLEGWVCHESQEFEWLVAERGYTVAIPSDRKGRIEYLKKYKKGRSYGNAARNAELLKQIYGEKVPTRIDFYELSEYGRKPCEKELDFFRSLGFVWRLK